MLSQNMTLFNYTLSIALAFEKDSPESMKQKTNGLDRHVFTPFMISSLMVSAVIETLISLGGAINESIWLPNCADIGSVIGRY